MITQEIEPARRIAPDFTLYLHHGFILIRPETLRARQHIEQHVADYEKWLLKFYFADGASILFGPGPGGGIYFKPKVNPFELGEKLVERGFIVVRQEQANPPFAQLVIGATYGNCNAQCIAPVPLLLVSLRLPHCEALRRVSLPNLRPLRHAVCLWSWPCLDNSYV